MADLLRANAELRKDRIWNWTLPAWYVRLDDGSLFKTCPNAGGCTRFCYARNGTYLFSNVKAAHKRNLDLVRDDPQAWRDAMIAELSRSKFRPTGTPRVFPVSIDDSLFEWAEAGGAAVRVHDSGDFFSREYLDLWLEIARAVPDVLFYAYTKEVAMFKGVDDFPSNFRYLFSYGGLQDDLIDADVDRHADVFPTMEAMTDAGYESQDANDLLCVLLPTTRVGITANNIKHFNKKMNGRRFSDL